MLLRELRRLGSMLLVIGPHIHLYYCLVIFLSHGGHPIPICLGYQASQLVLMSTHLCQNREMLSLLMLTLLSVYRSVVQLFSYIYNDKFRIFVCQVNMYISKFITMLAKTRIYGFKICYFIDSDC